MSIIKGSLTSNEAVPISVPAGVGQFINEDEPEGNSTWGHQHASVGVISVLVIVLSGDLFCFASS